MRIVAVLLATLTLWAQWKDPAKHEVHFVTVEEGVRLEVLDFGGTGRPLVLLTGSGNTAHVYDDFAAKLSGCCHVYAITRRGFGISSKPESGYTDQRFAGDVLAVLDALKIEKPVLVGHSMAGSELTTLGNQHSDRLSGLVYLDAGADPADFPWSDPNYRAVVQKLWGAPGKPSAAETNRMKSYQAYRLWQLEQEGWAFSEAEVRNMYDFNPDDSIGAFRSPSRVHGAIDAGAKKRDYSGIRVPVLAIFATPTPPRDSLDKERTTLQRQEYELLMAFINRYKKSLSAIPGARALDWPGARHYLFISQEADVLRELRTFLGSLSSPFAGTWEGKLNDLPAVEITIGNDGGGTVVFYLQIRGDDGKWHVQGDDRKTMLKPEANGQTLAFELQHYKEHGSKELGPNVKFRIELTSSNEAKLFREPDEGTGPVTLTRR